MEIRIPEISNQQIEAVLTFLPIFEVKNYTPGEWQEKDGFFPHYAYKQEVIDFIRVLGEQNIIFSFDWLEWISEMERYRLDPAALQSADLLTLRKLLTAHVRSDRFSEGHLAEVILSGQLVAILKKLAAFNEQGEKK